jgi:hypothetical protein
MKQVRSKQVARRSTARAQKEAQPLSARWQKLAPVMVNVLMRVYALSPDEAQELVMRRAKAVGRQQA